MSLDDRNEVQIIVKRAHAVPGVTVVDSTVILRSKDNIDELISKAKSIEKSIK